MVRPHHRGPHELPRAAGPPALPTEHQDQPDHQRQGCRLVVLPVVPAHLRLPRRELRHRGQTGRDGGRQHKLPGTHFQHQHNVDRDEDDGDDGYGDDGYGDDDNTDDNYIDVDDNDNDNDDDAGTPSLQDQHGDIPAHWACMLGRGDCVEVLVQTGLVDWNKRNIWGQTPLALALAGGHSDVVHILVGQTDVDFSVRNNYGQTLAQLAVLAGDLNCVETLAATEVTILYLPKNIYPIFPKKDPQKFVL